VFTEVLDRLNALGISVDVIDADFSGSVPLMYGATFDALQGKRKGGQIVLPL
jgi:hypothetical protein